MIFQDLGNMVFRAVTDVVAAALILKKKGRKIIKGINMKGFHVSDSLFGFLNNRYNISFKTVSGEGDSCTAEMTAPWKKTTLPHFFRSIDFMRFTTQMNLAGCFVYNLRIYSIFKIIAEIGRGNSKNCLTELVE